MAATLAPATLRRWVLLLLALGGSGIVCAWGLAQSRATFEAEGRVAHRLLSQRAAQLDATLATLVLLQPPAADAEQRLPAVVGPVLQVLRREGDEPWPAIGAALRDALAEAERASRPAQRAVLARADLAGRADRHYWLVQAGHPASFALKVDAQALMPTADWPYTGRVAARVSLRQPGVGALALDGPAAEAEVGDEPLLAFRLDKALASESQPFALRVVQPLRLADVPWLGLFVWWGLLALAAWAWRQLRRQRAERQRAQQLLRLGQVGRLNALGELAAGMAHELNQPLAAISANAQAARRLLDDSAGELAAADLATARGAMDQAVQQARRAADVITRLRRLVERPDVGGRLQPCALLPALQGALDLLQPQWRQLGVAIELEAPEPPPSVRADPVALEQILHNLLDNALQALAQVPAGTRELRLRLRREGELQRLDVCDTGPGLPPEVLPRLFEPFFTTREGGLGLGLSLCESLATGMGGSLSAAPAQPRGAVFTLKLPRVDEAGPH